MGKQKTHANRQVKTNNPPASPETQTDAQPVAKAVKQVNNPSHAPVLGRGSARLQKIHRALPTLSVIWFVIGFVMLVALPTDFFANQTYMSENAFQPAVAESQYSDALFQQAQQLTKEYLAHLDNYNPQNTSKSFSEWAATWIEDRLREIGLDAVYKHNFYVAPWVDPEYGRYPYPSVGVNVVGILHSPRTSGREALVLSTRSLHEKFKVPMKNPVSSLALGITLMQHFQNAKWLSRDVIFVVADGKYQDEGIRAWLHDYHHFLGSYGSTYFFFEHAFGSLHKNVSSSQRISTQNEFARSGNIRGAISLDFFEENFTYLVVCPEGINGKLPNLDLLNAIDRIASFGENSYTVLLNVNDPLVKFLYSIQAIDFKNFPIPLLQYISFVLHGAIGVPTGDHGWFHMYNIDAVTIRLHTGLIPGGRGQYGPILRVARVVESTFRSLSNLNERLHQSFYYYLLSNTFRYVSIGQYLIPYFIVLGSMCAFAGSHIISYDINPLFVICFPRSFVFYIGGLVLFGLTFFKGIYSYSRFVVALVTVSAVCLGIAKFLDKRLYKWFYGRPLTTKEFQLKARVYTTLAWFPLVMFFAVYSMINFPFCVTSILLFPPVIFLFSPTHKSMLRDLISSIGLIVFSLPVLMLLPSGWFANFTPNYLLFVTRELYIRYSNIILPFFTILYFPFNLSLLASALLDI